MNKRDVIDWKEHPVTQKALKAVDEAVQEIKDTSLMDGGETLDEITRKAIYREGLLDGVSSLKSWIDDLDLIGEFESID